MPAMKPETKLARIWAQLAGFHLWAKAKITLATYVETLGPEEVEEAIIIAAERDDSKLNRWRYFCGVCRSKARERLSPAPHPTTFSRN